MTETTKRKAHGAALHRRKAPDNPDLLAGLCVLLDLVAEGSLNKETAKKLLPIILAVAKDRRLV